MVFNGRVALVTGVDNDVGELSARRLDAEGARVVVCGWGRTVLNDLRDELDAEICTAGSLDRDALSAQLSELVERLGPVDVLVVSPGELTLPRSLLESPRQWRQMVEANLTGPFNLIQAVAPAMRERGWGRIIITVPAPDALERARLSAYLATAEGLIALTKTLGRELSRDGVLANAVVPHLDACGALGGRSGLPEMMASTVAFLAGDRASAYAGQILQPAYCDRRQVGSETGV